MRNAKETLKESAISSGTCNEAASAFQLGIYPTSTLVPAASAQRKRQKKKAVIKRLRLRTYEALVQKMHRYHHPPVSIRITGAVPCSVPGLSFSTWTMMKQRLMSVFFFSEGLIGQFPPGWCAVETYWIWTNYGGAPKWEQQEHRMEGDKETVKEAAWRNGLENAVRKATFGLPHCWLNGKVNPEIMMEVGEVEHRQVAWRQVRRSKMQLTLTQCTKEPSDMIMKHKLTFLTTAEE